MADDRLIHTLTYAGLSEKEAAVYMACLSMGKATAFRIAQHCQLKRSTVYAQLQQLNIDGFVLITKTPKATLYEALSPRMLLQKIEFRKKQLEESLPLLLAVYKEKPTKPHIEILEGEHMIMRVNESIVEQINAGKSDQEIRAFGSIDYLYENHGATADRLAQTVARIKKIRSRQLLNATERSTRVEKILRHSAKQSDHQIRTIANAPFQNDNIIFGDTLYIFSTSAENLFVLVIKNPEIAATYRQLFDMAWESAS